jgi:hypothetical protein
MKTISLLSVAAAVLFGGSIVQAAAAGPVRVLFLGHDGTGKGQASHQPGTAFPKLAQALGRDAVYFDYVTSVDEALGDASYLGKFDALLMYCNHAAITSQPWRMVAVSFRFIAQVGVSRISPNSLIWWGAGLPDTKPASSS